MPAPPFLQPASDGLLLRVKVQPRAPRSEVVGVLGDELKIKIAAPPVDSAANEALVEFLAERLDCPRRVITLLRGHRSPHKVLALHGLSLAEAAWRLLPTA
jgi:uncharacterized protein